MLEGLLTAIFSSGSILVVPGLLLIVQLAVYWYVKQLPPYMVLLRAVETSAFGGLTATAAAVAQPAARIHAVFGNFAVYVVLVMFLLWALVIVAATRLQNASDSGRAATNGQRVLLVGLSFIAFQLLSSGLDWNIASPPGVR